MNLTDLLTMNYVQMDTWSIRKNEPKTNPNEPKTNPTSNQKTTQRTQTNPIQTHFIAASPLPKPEQIQLQNVERLLALESVILIITGLE